MIDEQKIEELLTRGVEKIYPTTEFLRDILKSGKKISIYFGIDPTGPTLHVGHAVNLLKLKLFQELGHDVIILYGGFTAQIGDPTDKMSARQPLSARQVKKNTVSYKKLIGKILDLKSLKFVDNEKWSSKLKPTDLMDLASRFTVAQLLERDMFQERIRQNKEIHLHEFLYPVFQAYDAVTMDVDAQLGGNDQTFNMLAGRTLMRKMKNKEKAVVVMKLLVDPTGKKMGKTEGNMVSLDEKPEEMLGKIMSWPDSIILTALELCTTLPSEEISSIKAGLDGGGNPRDAKLKLAKAVVSLYHGEKKGEVAVKSFLQTFSEKKIPSDIPEFKTERGVLLSDCLLAVGVISSKTEWRRLAGDGAVSILLEDGKAIKINDFNYKIEKEAVFKVGKHRFLKILV